MKTYRILVIDDNEALREVLGEALTRRGYRVSDAPDASRGLQLLKAAPTDLVLLDVDLPDQSGLAVARRMRAARSTLPVIMMSATAEDGIDRKCREAGAVAFVRKPIALSNLLNRIARALEPAWSLALTFQARTTKLLERTRPRALLMTGGGSRS